MSKDNPNKALIDRLEKEFPTKKYIMNSLKQAEEEKNKIVLPRSQGNTRKKMAAKR